MITTRRSRRADHPSGIVPEDLVGHKIDLARQPASPDLLVLLEAAGYDWTIGNPPSQLWALQALGYLISQRGAA